MMQNNFLEKHNLGILAILFALYIFVRFIPDMTHLISVRVFLYLLTSLCLLIFGIGILRSSLWARTGIIITAIVYIIDSLEEPSSICEGD